MDLQNVQNFQMTEIKISAGNHNLLLAMQGSSAVCLALDASPTIDESQNQLYYVVNTSYSSS